MTERRHFVVIGANLTGGAAVDTLRSEGFDGRITLIGAEPHPPYERPPLSKEYLRGEVPKEQAILRQMGWYEDNGIDLLTGAPALALHPRDRAVELEGGRRLRYDAVLIATGGRNRRLSVPGRALEGVFDLRTFEDADLIRGAARPGTAAVVVGAGLIGCEVAASLRVVGVNVEVVEIFEAPMLRAVGSEVGRVFEGIHRDRGVTFHLGQAVERFEGTGDRVESVLTDRGTRIECDFVVVGVGIVPNVELVEATGVALDNGVVVDELCRTSVEGVYAAGDVANHYHPVFGRRLRVEHWDNALKQGAAAARSMMGLGRPFDDPHWFWSDQYGDNLQFVGVADGCDEFVVRGSMADRTFTGFYLSHGLVRAAVGVNSGKDVRRAAALITAGRPADPAALRDEDVDLRRLATSLRGG